MQIRVITKTRSKRPGVRKLTESVYEVAVSAAPVQGLANAAVVEMLASYFGVKKYEVQIKSGLTTVNKTVEIG